MRSSLPKPRFLTLRRLVALIFAGVVLLIVAAGVSGRVGYLVTNGVSMRPTYRAGDLVVVASASSYHIGDIVEYHGSLDGHLNVLHRIIGGDAAGFVVKGDSNQSIDPMHPRADQIVGRAVLHVPRIGAAIDSPITRIAAAIVVLALMALLIRNPAKSAATSVSRRAHKKSTAGWKLLIALDVLLVAAVATTFAMAAHPSPHPPPTFTQTGALTYQAHPRMSNTYPSGRIATGDPVFVKISRSVGVSFHIATNAPPKSVHGTVHLEAALTTASGWRTILLLAPATRLSDGAADVTAELNLTRILNLAASVAKATGVAAPVIDIEVKASAATTIGSQAPVAFHSALLLQLTPLELTMTGAAPVASAYGPAVVSTVTLSAAPPIAPADNSRSHEIERVLLAVLLVSLAATAIAWPADDRKNRARLADSEVHVPAMAIKLASSTTQIQISDRGALAQIARASGAPIVQHDNGWEGVFDRDLVYWIAGTSSNSEPTADPITGPMAASSGNSSESPSKGTRPKSMIVFTDATARIAPATTQAEPLPVSVDATVSPRR